MSEHQEEKKQEMEEEKAEEGSATDDESDEEKHPQDSPTPRPPSSPAAPPAAPGQADEERDEPAAAAAEEAAAAADDGNTENNPAPAVRLYKSSRLKGYITLALASFINYDAAQNSADVLDGNISVVPSTSGQRGYAVAVAVVSLTVSVFCLVTHLDRITPLQKFWSGTLFCDGSRFEGVLLALWSVWWAVGTGVATAVTGIAGDGKGQYSLYYSYWVCCLTTLWALERWWVAAGWSSLRSFISSWPNRSPAWICILVLSLMTLIWYVDLWQNHDKLDRPSEAFIRVHFDKVAEGQWQWLNIITVFTICPSLVFVLIELFRETTADGRNVDKSSTEVFVEGICFLVLALAWVPTVMIATTPRGAASLIGNSYFVTWLLTVFVIEGLIWFIHDKRKETHRALKEKGAEYRREQRKVLEQAREIHRKHEEREHAALESAGGLDSKRERLRSSGSAVFFDAVDNLSPPSPDQSRERLQS